MTANLGIVNGVTRSPQSLGTGVADSSTFLRGDGSWSTTGLLHISNRDNAIRGIPNTLAIYTGSTTVAVVGANRLNLHPIYLTQAINVTRAEMEVTALVAGSNMVMGIYRAEVRSSRVVPTRLVAQFGGVQSGATLGLRTVTGLNLNLDPGFYCLAWSTDATMSLRYLSGVPLGAVGQVASSGSANVFYATREYYYSQTYDSSLPSHAPSGLPSMHVDASATPYVRCPIWIDWTLR